MPKKIDTLIFRQGDVLLRPVTRIPEGAKPVESQGRVVLAYGEVTGHAHAFYSRATMFRDDGLGRTFISAEAGAELRHEEHTALQVPPGEYELINQLQYTPEAIRRVED